MNFFIVDDEEQNRNFLKTVLAFMFPDANILEAFNGLEARDKLAEMVPDVPDIIFSDFVMPASNGVRLLHFVKDHRTLKDIPFVLLSGVTNPQSLKEAVSAYSKAWFVQKPFFPPDLMQLVWEILDNSDKS